MVVDGVKEAVTRPESLADSDMRQADVGPRRLSDFCERGGGGGQGRRRGGVASGAGGEGEDEQDRERVVLSTTHSEGIAAAVVGGGALSQFLALKLGILRFLIFNPILPYACCV